GCLLNTDRNGMETEYMTLLMRERDIEKRARAETRAETRAEDIQTLIASLRFFGISDEEILQQLVERYHLTSDEANEFLNLVESRK
ncbi:MAG: hypothetical protein NC489_24755, partial [Ruminococcus flavefaciens]|nr:hypothetical protein [Ruminococcus flavefaciens]